MTKRYIGGSNTVTNEGGHGKPFEPGQSGNPRGRPRDRSLDELLDEFLEYREPACAEEVVRILAIRLRHWDQTAFKLIQAAIEHLPSEQIRYWQVKWHQQEVARIQQRSQFDKHVRAAKSDSR